MILALLYAPLVNSVRAFSNGFWIVRGIFPILLAIRNVLQLQHRPYRQYLPDTLPATIALGSVLETQLLSHIPTRLGYGIGDTSELCHMVVATLAVVPKVVWLELGGDALSPL
jgi:hypothetical protein